MKHSKGFTLIELLVAALFIMLVMIGFLRGILYYMQFSLDARMKDSAGRSIREWSGYLESLPYSAPLINPNTYHSTWGSASCNMQGNCTFEEEDVDGDRIPDFYDPYEGNNNNFTYTPLNTTNWLWLRPNSTCDNCPPLIRRIGNREVYVGITIARQNNDIGKAFGITAWYFSPIDRSYKYVSTTLIKRRP